MLSLADIPTQRSTLANGDAGTDQTVAAMRTCAMGNYGAKSPKIREFAFGIVNKSGVPNKDYRGMTVAVHNWVRDNIRYINDPIGQETLCHPEYTLQLGAGDCDDLSTLEAALLGSLGIDTQFVVVGLRPAPAGYSHVYLRAEVKTPTGMTWMPLDPIMRQYPAGWEVPNAKRKKIYDNNSNGGSMNGIGDLFSEPIGQPNQTYVGNPARLHSFLKPGPNTQQNSDNYVAQNANDDGWNDPQILPTQAFGMQAGVAAIQARPGWKSHGKAPFGFLNGLAADFETMRPSMPTNARPYANVRPVRAQRQGVDHMLAGGTVSVETSQQIHERTHSGPQLTPVSFGSKAMSQRPPTTGVAVAGLGDDTLTAAVAAPGMLAPTLLKSAAVAAVVWYLFLRK